MRKFRKMYGGLRVVWSKKPSYYKLDLSPYQIWCLNHLFEEYEFMYDWYSKRSWTMKEEITRPRHRALVLSEYVQETRGRYPFLPLKSLTSFISYVDYLVHYTQRPCKNPRFLISIGDLTNLTPHGFTLEATLGDVKFSKPSVIDLNYERTGMYITIPRRKNLKRNKKANIYLVVFKYNLTKDDLIQDFKNILEE